MYVSKIAEQLKEYDRLQKLIDNIEQALEDLEPDKALNCTVNNYTINWGTDTTTKQAVINNDVTNLMLEDLKELLHKHCDALREQQLWLEV